MVILLKRKKNLILKKKKKKKEKKVGIKVWEHCYMWNVWINKLFLYNTNVIF